MPDHQPDHRRYEQAKDILQRVLDLTPGARSAYLQTACGDDTGLRAEVESLLDAHNDVNSSFLDSPLAFLQHDDSESKPEDVDLTGKRVGAYRLERLLGRGGMGAVYLATRVDGEFSKHVAIKFIRTSRVSPAALKRFKAERQILADIDHPNIARLIDGGTAEGMPFFIMEYVPGDTLAQAIERGPLPVDRVVRLALGVAEVLEAIHAKGLVFRDLKPSNIILNDDTGVKVLDFGIAKLMQADTGDETTRSTLTGAGFIIGSPRYMSPEQASGEAVDARSDIFSFGLVMFEALTGRLPFSGTSRKEYFKNLVAHDADELPAAVPPRLRAVIERCLKKDPAERFRSGHELADAVRATATPDGFFGSRSSWVALLIVTLAVAAFGLWTAGRPDASNEPLLKGAPTPLTAWAGNETCPRISPDLKWVSFIADRDGKPEILVQSRTPGTERAIAPVAGQLIVNQEWSPASDRIAYLTLMTDGKEKLNLASIAGGAPITYELEQQNVSLVRWLPGGVYFLSGGSLWKYDLNSARATEVSTGRGKTYIYSADVSADERDLVFSSMTKDRITVLWHAGLDASAPIRLTDDRIAPRYARWKGTRARAIVFVSEEGGMVDIWQLDIANKRRQRLTANENREGRLDVSADGRELVYEQIREDAHLATFTPGDGKSSPTQITAESLNDMFPSTSATGGDLVFQRSKGIMTFGMRNGTIRASPGDIVREPRVIGDGYGPEMSPDGRWVVYPQVGPTGLDKLWMVEIAQPLAKPLLITDVFRRPGHSSFPETFTESVLAWSSQSPKLYFRALAPSGGLEIWAAEPVAGSAAVSVQQLTSFGDPSAEIGDLRLSAAGDRLSYLLQSADHAGTELHIKDFARKQDRVELATADGIVLASPGWLQDDSIVVLRSHGDQSLTDVILTKNGRQTTVGQIKDLTWGSAVIDPRLRTLYFTRDVGVVHAIHALVLDPLARQRERSVLSSDPHGQAFSGVRVMADGKLVFAVETQNYDILSYRFDK
jgi:serine/threonine protein kinase/Tol biopolymer transport system component